jgi:protocatechuate 3,4-dioxygenase beta subunit
MTARAMFVAAVLLAATNAAAGQTPRDRPLAARDKPEATGTGIIAGIVVTADERQQPVRRASVMLASGQAVTPRTVVTDDAGRFEFTALAPGNYTLVGQKPAWVPAIYGARSATDSQGVPIAVANGQRVDGLRLPMVRGGVISGTIRLPGGQPASELMMQVMRVRQVDGRRELSAAAAPAQTNDRGEFRAFGLAPGDYVVQARSTSFNPFAGSPLRQVTNAEVRWGDQRLQQAQDSAQAAAADAAAPPEGPTVTYSAVYFPGTSFASDATVVTIRAGEERANVDFALRLDPTVKVTGSVIGPDGSPVSGAVVQLESEDSESGDMMGLMMRTMGGAGRATTRPDGSFTMSGVTSGRYTLTARAAPRRPGETPSPTDAAMAEAMAMMNAMSGITGAENPNTLWASEPLVVSGQDIGPLTLGLREGLKVEGAVLVEGGAKPADITLLRIGLSKPTGSDPTAAMLARMMGSSIGLPKESGSFTVAGLLPGRYQVAVTGKPMRGGALFPGLAPAASGWVVKSIKWKDQDLADSGLDLLADVPVSGVVVTLTNQPAELGGTVIDAAGRPTGAFPIVVYSTDRAFWSPGGRRVVQAQPASDGKFNVIGLPAGEYYLAAVTRLEPGDLANRQFLEELVPASLRITIRDGEKKTQDVKLSGGMH